MNIGRIEIVSMEKIVIAVLIKSILFPLYNKQFLIQRKFVRSEMAEEWMNLSDQVKKRLIAHKVINIAQQKLRTGSMWSAYPTLKVLTNVLFYNLTSYLMLMCHS